MIYTWLSELGGWSSSDYAREMWNGAWFMLTLSMVVALLSIAVDRAHKVGLRATYGDLGIQICLAFTVFVMASGIRAGYTWMFLHCQNFTHDCRWNEVDDWMMTIAGTLAVCGGLCVIRVMSPARWLPWSWVIAAVFGVMVPLAYYGLAAPKLQLKDRIGLCQVSCHPRVPLVLPVRGLP